MQENLLLMTPETRRWLLWAVIVGGVGSGRLLEIILQILSIVRTRAKHRAVQYRMLAGLSGYSLRAFWTPVNDKHDRIHALPTIGSELFWDPTSRTIVGARSSFDPPRIESSTVTETWAKIPGNHVSLF